MSRRSEFKERADAVLAGLKESGERPRLLLHACCAPCCSYVLEYLADYFEITVFYYNPNIYPADEYERRIKELDRLIREMKPEASLLAGMYDPEAFDQAVSGFESEKEGGKRCELCFRLRLLESAKAAKEAGCDYFTTTLTISPHKNAAVINRIGEEIAKETGITWFPSDFKKNGGFQRSIELSAKYGLYRQDYCGCVYSIRNTENKTAPGSQQPERHDSVEDRRREIIMEEKFKVAILGATGMVGQRFISLLEKHPWFEVVKVAASARSAGKTYEEAVGSRWKMTTPMPEGVKKLVVADVSDVENVAKDVDFVFSAVDMTKEEIRAIEDEYAKTETPVVSNNSAHRWTPDVPMVVPEINPQHFDVIEFQKKRLGTKKGFVAVKPNCSIQSYAPALFAWREFEPYEVIVSTYQAISGAGKTFKDWPEMVENIIPYISGEEEKSEQEPLRIFGYLADGEIVKAEEPVISCQCIRVPVLNGHTATVSVKFRKKPTKDQLIERLINFKGLPQERNLPTAPKQFIQYLEEDNRPQVKMDVDYENGMGVSVGRLREDNVYDWKFVALSHNTIRGAAGGAILCAESLVSLGYIEKK